MKAELAVKKSNQYQSFIKKLRAVFARDERLYNFVCESLPKNALHAIKKQVSGPIRRLTYKKLMKAQAERAAERARQRQNY